MVELVDTQDLKSCDTQISCGFDSRPRYKLVKGFRVLEPFIFYFNLFYGYRFGYM